MHGKMAGLLTVWHGSGPSHSPMHSPSHSLSHCLRNDGLSPRITFGAALTSAYRPAEIRPRRRSSAHLPSPRGRVRSPKTRFPPIEFSCGEAVSPRSIPCLRLIALGMSYYSASMSWDLTRLTSSKVVVHNTCSTGTAIDRSGVYRYHRYHRYRYHQASIG